LPLSYAQQRLWFLDQLKGMSPEYNLPFGLRLMGELDQAALERAIQTIVERHETLRTRFAEFDGEAVQIIEPQSRVELAWVDLSGLKLQEQKDRVSEALQQEGAEPFQLSRGPLLRVKLLRLSDREHVLLHTMHHIISDGWSEGVFNRELGELYEAYRKGRENPLKPLPVQYADFTLWERKRLESGVLEEGLKYWRKQLEGIPERLDLPADHPRQQVQTFHAEAFETALSPKLSAGLKQLSRDNQATLYMTLMAAFGVLLWRYTGQDDIVVGSPIANRQDPQLEEMIGFFVNTLVIRVKMKPEETIRALLAKVRLASLEAYQHQDIPFESVVEELSPERSLNMTPLYQVIFALQNAPWRPLGLEGLQTARVRGTELRVRTDLEVHAGEEEDQVRFLWVYDRDLFDRWRIEQMARHYERMLEWAVARPDEQIDRMNILDQQEQLDMIENWNSTEPITPLSN
jgi:hypothetical protein